MSSPLSALSIKNFKCHLDLDLPLSGLTVLAGRNGSGKSTILQVLGLLRQSWETRSLEAGRLPLNGRYASLGTASDVLCEDAKEDRIEFGVRYEDGESFVISLGYVADDDVLTMKSLPELNGQVERAPFHDRTHLIAAERLGPRVTLPLSADRARAWDLGPDGAFVLQFLQSWGDQLDVPEPARHADEKSIRLGRQTAAWMREISPGVALRPELLHSVDQARPGFQFDRPGDVASRAYRATNVGFGLSYTLPVIVALLAAGKGGLVAIENPEAHLHPEGQTAMGRLAALVAASGAQVIMETHSDHVLDAVRIAVREGLLPPEAAALHYFRRDGVLSEVESPEISADGRLSLWPDGFFDQREQNLAKLVAPRRGGS